MKKFNKWAAVLVVIIGALIANYRKYEYKNPELISAINSMNREYCSIVSVGQK